MRAGEGDSRNAVCARKRKTTILQAGRRFNFCLARLHRHISKNSNSKQTTCMDQKESPRPVSKQTCLPWHPTKLCERLWLLLLELKKKMQSVWKKINTHVCKNKRTCVPAAHGSTGRWLIRSLTYFAQPIGWKLRRCLRISHDRFGSSSDLCINGHLHYPNDVDRSLNEDPTNKIRKYRSDYNNNPPNFISFIPVIIKLLVRLGGYIVNLYDFYFYKLIGKLTAFLHLQELNLHYQTVDFSTTSEGRSRTTWNQRL